MNIFKYKDIRGFNYQPSYAWNTYEAWKFFDENVFDLEIGRGKSYFPKMNTVRIWLSYDAFRYQEDRQAENFEKVIAICDKYNCKVIPVLFNCWHDSVMDAGGIYHSQMIPESIWCSKENMYDSYFEKIVKPHITDERILLWDICNEPYSYGSNEEFKNLMINYETEWLKKMCILCKATGIKQPLGISLNDANLIDLISDFVDVHLVHPYYFGCDEDLKTKDDKGLDKVFEKILSDAEKFNKPVLTTETCWGSKIDANRVEIIRRTLEAHNRAGVGFIVHALNYSFVADLHDECDAPISSPGNLAFVTKDGKIRPGHEIFNKLA